jgi:hypothetical protein
VWSHEELVDVVDLSVAASRRPVKQKAKEKTGKQGGLPFSGSELQKVNSQG